jgi:hypothetical protein
VFWEERSNSFLVFRLEKDLVYRSQVVYGWILKGKKKKEKRLLCGELVCKGFGLMIEGEWKISVLRMEGKKCW